MSRLPEGCQDGGGPETRIRILTQFIRPRRYFRNGPFFGVAAFGRAAGAVEDERGSRLRAVGILSPSYVGLAGHVAFLRSRVRHALRCPGDYAELLPYYEATKCAEHMPRIGEGPLDRAEALGAESESPASSSSAPSPVPSAELEEPPQPSVPQILQELPPGQLATFVDYFGPQVFLVGAVGAVSGDSPPDADSGPTDLEERPRAKENPLLLSSTCSLAYSPQ